jgi:ankyrin repeat protein
MEPTAPFSLHDAAAAGDAAQLKLLLDAIDREDDDEFIPGDDSEEDEASKGRTMNSFDRDHCTPLHAALLHLQYECARVCLEAGAELRACNGLPVAHLLLMAHACRAPGVDTHSIEMCTMLKELIVEHGMDVNCVNDAGLPLVSLCAYLALPAALSTLTDAALALGTVVNWNATDANGRTALHWAARTGCSLTVQAVLSAGCTPCVQDVVGNTAAHTAAYYGSVSCMEALGCADVINAWGLTPSALYSVCFGQASVAAAVDVITHATSLRHHTCTGISRRDRCPPENVRRLHVLLPSFGGVLGRMPHFTALRFVNEFAPVKVHRCTP